MQKISAEGKDIEDCFRTPELIENDAIDKIWKNFNPVLRKKRCTYKDEFLKWLDKAELETNFYKGK